MKDQVAAITSMGIAATCSSDKESTATQPGKQCKKAACKSF